MDSSLTLIYIITAESIQQAMLASEISIDYQARASRFHVSRSPAMTVSPSTIATAIPHPSSIVLS